MKTYLKLALTLIFLGVSLSAQSFSVDPQDNRNLASFTSDAPFEKIVGLANELEAIVMININNITDKPRGMVKIPIKNIKTGIDLRDEHLRSEMWLNAEKFPFAEFTLKAITSPSSKVLNDGERIKTVLIGDFKVHGVNREIEVPVKLSYYLENEKTKTKMPGNLLVANAEFEINLKDYGVSIPSMVIGKVSDNVKIIVNFVASDASGSGNPCNPCAPKK